MENNLIDMWEKAEPEERAEFIELICQRYHPLLCRKVNSSDKCNVAWLKKYLFGGSDEA